MRMSLLISPLLCRGIVSFVWFFCWSFSAVFSQNTRIAFDFEGENPGAHLPWTTTSVLEVGWNTTGWTRGSGLSASPPIDNGLGFQIAAGEDLTTLPEAQASGQFLSVGLFVEGGPLDLGGHRVAYSILRVGWHAPRRYAVFSNLDDFAEPLFISPLLENAADVEDAFTFVLPEAAFGSASGTIEFRIYPFAARFAGHPAALTSFLIRTTAGTAVLHLSAQPGGIISAVPARTLFEIGETAELRAEPAPGYRFGGWSGGLTGRGNPRLVEVTGDLSISALFEELAPVRMDLGGNLDGLADWSTAWVFKNCFLLARPWLTRTLGSFEWESGQTPPLDADGWPEVVPFTGSDGAEHFVHTLVPLYESGTYTIRFSGSGRIEANPPGGPLLVWENTTGTFSETVEMSVQADGSTLLLAIVESAAHDPIRDVQIIAPGQAHEVEAQPFHEAFLQSLAPYRVIRFMDWGRTNGSQVSSWPERTTATHFTQARAEGASLEMMILLANEVRAHPWICLPHLADEDYIRQTARLLRDSLDPNLRVYVEYSNETWNTMPDFTQTPYVMERGIALGLDPDPLVAGNLYSALRSVEIFRIFSEEFGAEGRHRHVNVLGTMAGFVEGVTAHRVRAVNDPAINPDAHLPDALAIAPYFGVNFIPVEGTGGDEQPLVDPMPTVDELVVDFSLQTIPEAFAMALAHRAIADEQGWRLICYEGGQHFTGIFGAENNDTLTERIFAANRDPRMEDRYREYLAGLEAAGVDLFANFTHIGEWSKWGTWSALESQLQSPEEAPKWRALLAWAAEVEGRIDPIIVRTLEDGSGGLDFIMRPDRTYTLETSSDLREWESAGFSGPLRGDGVRARLSLPMLSSSPNLQLFLRFRID